MRTFLAIGLALLVLGVVACVRDDEACPAVEVGAALPPRRRGPAEVAAAAGASATITVEGALVTSAGEPVRGRAVALLDARGAASHGVTSATGGFVVTDVLPPYDVAVASTDASSFIVYAGLSRTDPHVALEDAAPRVVPAPPRTIRVAVSALSCPSWSCSVAVSTSSPSGAGGESAQCTGAEEACAIEVTHRWRVAAVPDGEAIELHVLVASEDPPWFGHARRILVGPSSADLGPIEVEPVSVVGPVSIGASADPMLLAEWGWRASVGLTMPASDPRAAPAFVFARPSASTTLFLPALPGATMNARIVATSPRGGEEGGFAWSAEAWSGGVPVGGVALDVRAGPELVRPPAGGTLSRRAPGIEWTAPFGAALSRITVVDVARASPRLVLFTDGDAARFGRLAALGVPRLDVGAHAVELATWRGRSVEDVASPAPDARRAHEDRARGGAATVLRTPLVVTP